MALLPDPTTAASERSSVKNRLTGSRRRGSGINRHRSRTVSKTSLRGRHRVQAHPGGVQGQSLCNQPYNTKNETNVPELSVKPITQHPVLCAGGSSRTNGSRYPPLSARRGLPGWLQPASSTSPWLFYQVSSEVFSKSSSVMSPLLLL